MLYYLAQFRDAFSPLNLFYYISFRSGGAMLSAFLITFLTAPSFIRFVLKNRVTQIIRLEGPQTHQSKSNTPIMGGLLILASTVISTLLWARMDNRFIWLCLSVITILGILGWTDDYRKWKRKKEGLAPSQKKAVQLALALALATYLYISPPNPDYVTQINIPYFKNLFVNLGQVYVCFAVMVLVGSSNSVNLTDGLG